MTRKALSLAAIVALALAGACGGKAPRDVKPPAQPEPVGPGDPQPVDVPTGEPTGNPPTQPPLTPDAAPAPSSPPPVTTAP